MKKILLLIIVLSSACYSLGQTLGNSSFMEQKALYEEYYSTHDKGRGTGFKVFKRWEEFVHKHLDTNQRIINNTAMAFKALDRMKKRGELNQTRGNSYWSELGPDEWTNNPDPYPGTSQGGWIPGNGRINEVVIDPNNSSIIYAGAAGGGLWKSIDNGSNWTCLTDELPNLAVSGIAVSHSNSDIVYLLTGDLDSRELVSIGVLKSTDGGSTWNSTGLLFDRDEIVYGSEMKMNYDNSSELIATTDEGIYYTDNAGVSWNLAQAGKFFDVEYHPTNPDTVYASTPISVYRSTNGGQNWSQVIDLSAYPTDTSRIELAVTLDNPDKLYAVLGDRDRFRGLFFSEDRGENWLVHTNNNPPNILGSDTAGFFNGTQAPYDLTIEISPIDENEVIVGGINIWKSPNGGLSWERLTYWRQDFAAEEYVHADIHELIFDGTKLYAGTDGGICRSNDYGVSWTDLSVGLRIMQPHKIGITKANTDLVYLGTQDNGVNRYSGTTTFENVRGADGFECHIWPYDSDTVFTSRQYGIIESSVDGGATFSVIISENPDDNNKTFNNPFILRAHPTQGRIIVSDASEIQIKNLTGGSLFSKFVADDELHYINNMDMSSLNNDLLIACLSGRDDDTEVSVDSIWMTTTLLQDGANTWSNITSNLLTFRWIVSDVVIDPYNPSHFVVTYSGYNDGNKVFETWNSGASWSNTSYNLENVPVNCIAIDPDIPNSVYVGTDLGVFYKEPEAETWIYYSENLPPVMVHELEINSTDNLIYAATYGRGLWRSPLFDECVENFVLTPDNDPSDPDNTGFQHYEAASTLISTRQIQGGEGTNVHYQAGNYIELEPGFRAHEGNVFRSVIGNCGEVVSSSTKSATSKAIVDDDQ